MAKHKINELVRCEYCGEDYSATYRRCPFCNDTGILEDEEDEAEHSYQDDNEEYDEYDEYDEELAPRGGRRLAKESGAAGRRRFFRVVGSVVAVGLLVTIVLLVLHISRPLLEMVSPDNTTSDSDSSAADETDGQDEETAAAEDETGTEPSESDSSNNEATDIDENQTSDTDKDIQAEDDAQTQTEDTGSKGQNSTATDSSTATNLTLSREDFSLFKVGETYTITATLSPAGSTAAITWESENPSIASVNDDGKVTAVGKGTTTITAMIPNGATKSCVVRCNITGTSTSTSTSTSSGSTDTTAANTNYGLNNTDFTMHSSTETYRLKVQDYSGSVTWSSSNQGVATVSSDGTVSPVANGVCNVTAKLPNGESLTCIVRVHFST